MAGMSRRLPFSFSGRKSAGSSSYSLSDVSFDLALGGMPWLLSANDNRPLKRGGAQIRKDQFDAAREPGEQSLVSWWLRSQSTFIGGAGAYYQDPDQVQVANLQNKHQIQFGSSVGVNPWVNGELSLLRRTVARIADASANKHMLLGWNDGTDRVWSAVGTALRSDDGTTATTITWGGANVIQSLTTDGTNYFAADSVNVYKGTGSGAGAAWAPTGTTRVVIRWVKGRIMMGQDNLVYETNSTGTKTLRFTHLNPAWTWTDFAEGTNGIYAAGFAGSNSAIYKFVLDSTGNVPTLASGGIITAQLPQGEVVNCLTSYLGTFVGIGTNRGLRVGQIDTNGDIVYGPLLITNSAGVKAIGAYDRFLFATATNDINGKSGLYRVDLGQPIDDRGSSAGARFAWTTDLQTGVAGEVTSVTNFGNSDRMCLAVTGQGSYLEHATEKEPTGSLTTGRVRYNTLEPKIFKFVSVRTPNSILGSVGVAVLDPGGGDTSIITISQGGASPAIDNVILPAPGSAVEWIQLRITLGRSTTNLAKGGVVNGWQLKAMPGATRQRLLTVPLSCFDKEKDRTGQEFGHEGYALERLTAFEQIFQRGDAVSFQDLANGTSDLVVIDDYEFSQSASPGPNKTTVGGYLMVQLRTIADVSTY